MMRSPAAAHAAMRRQNLHVAGWLLAVLPAWLVFGWCVLTATLPMPAVVVQGGEVEVEIAPGPVAVTRRAIEGVRPK